MSDIIASMIGLAPGAVGGVCSVFIGHPIDLIKVRMQVGGGGAAAAAATSATTASSSAATTPSLAASASRLLMGNKSNNASTFGMLRGIFVAEGVPGLYRGVQAPLLAVTPAFAVSFWSYDVATRAIMEYHHSASISINNKDNNNNNNTEEEHPRMKLSEVAAAGAFSGIPLAAIVGPTERIKCLMQVQQNSTTNHKNASSSGFLDCLRSVYREGGIRSVFRGTGSTALRDVPGNAAYFGTYEFVKRLACQLEGKDSSAPQPSILGTLFAGGCAGVANWIIAIPFDTIKSRLQTAPHGKYTGFVDVLQSLLREEGPRALFRGLSPALLRAFPANAACLCGVETVKKMIEDR